MESMTHNSGHMTHATTAISKAAIASFVLTEGDIAILRLIHEHRFLRREQIGKLTGRHAKRVHRRVLKLAQRGFLSTIRLPQQKHIYGVGQAAVSVLVEQGLCDTDVASQRVRTHELKELFLRHEMMIVDVHVALSQTVARENVQLISWKEGNGLYDSVVAIDNRGSNRLPVRPDAFFTLADPERPEGANRANFALEADRSTTTQTRFEEKIRAYWSYIEQGRHVQKYGVKGFRVLTVTVTDARARNLCALAASTLPERGRKYFLFVSLDRLLSERGAYLRDPACYSARTAFSSELHALVPSQNQLQKELLVV